MFTFTNTGEGPVTVTAVTTTGDYSVSNNCTTVATGGTCTANVVFKPTAVGSRTGTVAFATNIASATFTSTLTGTGLMPDFTIGDASGNATTTATVASGGAASVALTITPINSFTGTINLTCASTGTAPVGTSCVVPPTITLAAAATSFNVGIATTSRVSSSGFAVPTGGNRSSMLLFASLAGLVMLLASRSRRLARSTRAARLFSLLLLAALGSACIGLMGCGKSNTNPNGTAAGTYTFVVTATSGTLTHAETITLTVQ